MRIRRRRLAGEVALGKWEEILPSRRLSTPVDRVSLEDAIRSLPNVLRSVFVLKEVEGFAHEEISELLGIQIGTSKARLSRARSQLRAQFQESL